MQTEDDDFYWVSGSTHRRPSGEVRVMCTPEEHAQVAAWLYGINAEFHNHGVEDRLLTCALTAFILWRANHA